MSKPELPNLFNKYQESLNIFTKEFYDDLSDPLYFTHKYFLGWVDQNGNPSESSGKAFRPSIMMLINESLEGSDKNILPIAMSIELFHNFSLIHDDIEDKDEFRRNRETVWKIWGEEAGIISGNSMHALASKALDSVETNNDYKLIELRKLVNETCIEVIEGQYLDIDFEKRKEISLDDYLEMIEKKTGALIKTSVILGSILKDSSKDSLDAFSEIGKSFGHMFQIKDDVLGIWGDDKFGKPIGSDILKKKKSFPILKLFQSSNKIDKKNINMIFSKEQISENDKNKILKMMEKYNIKSYCDSILSEKYNYTKKLIISLSINDSYKSILEEINYFLMHRTK